MALKLITAPSAEPVTLAEAKTHLRVFDNDDDALIGALIQAAREACEHEIGRALITQTWEKVLDLFPEGIALPYPPVQSIASIKYIDGDGTLRTMDAADYYLDSHAEPAWLVPAYGATWPSTRDEPNAVRVRFVSGYGADGTFVPEVLRQWILLQVGHWYATREAASERVLEKTPFVDRLLDRYRIVSIA